MNTRSNIWISFCFLNHQWYRNQCAACQCILTNLNTFIEAKKATRHSAFIFIWRKKLKHMLCTNYDLPFSRCPFMRSCRYSISICAILVLCSVNSHYSKFKLCRAYMIHNCVGGEYVYEFLYNSDLNMSSHLTCNQ